MDKLHFKDDFETQNIRVVRHCINSFGVNTYFLISKHTRDTAVIDPGGVADVLLAALKEEHANVRRILFTHTHIDHIYAADELKKALPEALVTYHIKDQPVIESLPDMCRMFGVPCRTMPSMDCDLEKEPEFSVGDLQIRSILTPGHTPGAMSWFFEIREGEECYKAALHGGMGINTLSREFLDKYQLPYTLRDDFLRSMKLLSKESVDVFLGNHMQHNHTEEKAERVKSGDRLAFVDPDEWKAYNLWCIENLNAMIEREGKS